MALVFLPPFISIRVLLQLIGKGNIAAQEILAEAIVLRAAP